MVKRTDLDSAEDFIEKKIFNTFRPFMPFGDEDVLDEMVTDLVDEIMDTIVTEINSKGD